MGAHIVPGLDDLVNETRLSPERYVEIVTAAALAALENPIGKQ